MMRLYIDNKESRGLCIFLWAIFILFAASGIYLRYISFNSVHIGVHGWLSRDIDRALNIVDGNYLPLAGPESNAGGRLPGPFMYIFLAIPLFFRRAYESVFVFNWILNIGSIVGLYCILKRNFSFCFSVISASLLSICVNHIASVGHPINPVYLFPFVIAFIGFLFELILKNRVEALVWIILVLSLGIQFHYSMAILYLVPVVLLFVFKIAISRKVIIKSLAVGVFCFLPYVVHKMTIYEPEKSGNIGTFNKLNWINPLSVLKAVGVQNEITRISSSEAFYPIPWRNNLNEDKESKLLRRLVLSFVFYFLTFFLIIKFKNSKIEKYRREVTIFVLFYIPTFTYEIVKPFTVHHWYVYVLIFPTILVLSWFVDFVVKENRGLPSLFFLFMVLILMGIHSRVTFKQILGSAKALDSSLTLGSYENSKLLLNKIMQSLDLTSNDYYRRVYFLDFKAASINRIKMALNDFKKESPEYFHSNKKPCFFIFDERGYNLKVRGVLQNKSQVTNSRQNLSFQSFAIDLFKTDPTININFKETISFQRLGFAKSFNVYEYYPLKDQSCYNNGFNPFLTRKKFRKLLIKAKNSGQEPLKVDIKEKYSTDSQLEFFRGQYIVFNRLLQTPFRVTATIYKKGSQYRMKTELDTYYFWGDNNYHMRWLNLNILSTSGKVRQGWENNFLSPLKRAPYTRKFSFLSKDTIASKNSFISTFNSNQEWYREISLPKNIILYKNGFFLDLNYKMGQYLDGGNSFFNTSNVGLINLKSPYEK